jgi:hypothetical protein
VRQAAHEDGRHHVNQHQDGESREPPQHGDCYARPQPSRSMRCCGL